MTTLREMVYQYLRNNNVPENTSKSEIAKRVCHHNGIEYDDGKRRYISRVLNNTSKALVEECDNVGINVNTVTSYWYKGKHFSIHAKGDRDVVNMEEVVSDLVDKISKHAPKYPKTKVSKSKDPHLLVVDIADAHFGKLSSAYETGDEYNIEIAKKRVIDGFNGILSKASAFSIEKIMLVIGNDALHFDNAKNTTTSGTYQDGSAMFYDVFNIALDTYVMLIESVMNDVAVDVVFNPSNHDYVSGWMLARTLEAWFRNAKNVTFDCTISHRKYYKYGKNLIATSHGDGAKMQDMPMLMANEAPKMWSDTEFRYVYLHHIHHKKVTKFQSGQEYIGVTVEYLRTPSAADSWHNRNGYCGANKAIEGFLHHSEYGQVARLSHYFK